MYSFGRNYANSHKLPIHRTAAAVGHRQMNFLLRGMSQLFAEDEGRHNRTSHKFIEASPFWDLMNDRDSLFVTRF